MIGGNRMSDKGQKLVVGHFGVSDEIELFIEVGYDHAKRRKPPVSRMPYGRVVIFRMEPHNNNKQKRDNTKAQFLPLEEKESALANELQAVKNALATLKDEKTRAASDLEMFSKSIDTFKGMEVPDDISIEEIEQNAGVYGIPDYWGQMTEESKKDNGNDDRQIGKAPKEYQNKGARTSNHNPP